MPQHRHKPDGPAEQDAARLKISPAINTPSPAWLDLIEASCRAEELFGVDECERFAEELRRRRSR